MVNKEPAMSATAPREKAFLLAQPEQRLLEAIARRLAAALGLVIAYLALSINTYLETQALGRFTLGYGRLGPTEARLALLGLLAAVALGAELSWLGLTLL